VYTEVSGRAVLTSEWVTGESLDQLGPRSQQVRDKIGQTILNLTLREIFQFHFMQTDPNWSNFFWNHNKQKVRHKQILNQSTKSINQSINQSNQIKSNQSNQSLTHLIKSLNQLSGCGVVWVCYY